jgi:hypothetical protein
MGSVLYEHVAKPEYHEVLSSRGEIEAYLLTSDEHGSTKEDENLDPSTVVHGVTSQRNCEVTRVFTCSVVKVCIIVMRVAARAPRRSCT